jgi:hypothetical protein
METESSDRNVVFQIKNRTMNYVQELDNCINVPSSEAFRSSLEVKVFLSPNQISKHEDVMGLEK